MPLERDVLIKELQRFLNSELGKAVAEFRRGQVESAKTEALTPCNSTDECLIGEYAKGLAKGMENDPAKSLLDSLNKQIEREKEEEDEKPESKE